MIINQPYKKEFDPRSFHVFEAQNKFFMFDRASGATLELGIASYEVLKMLENGGTWSEALSAGRTLVPDLELADLDQFFNAVRSRGMFEYIPVDHAEQESYLQSLWNHKPRRIQLLMAQGCNLGCRYCYAWRNGSNQKGTLMEWDVAKAAVDHLVAKSKNRPDLMVTFFGGEPLLNFSMVQRVVDYCYSLEQEKKKRFSFEIITNGTLLTKEITDYLAKNKFWLMVSIDGWEEMHNYNRPSMDRDNCYAEILSNALYAVGVYREKKLPEVKVRANLTGKYHDAPAVYAYFHKLGFSKIGIAAIEPLPHGYGSPAAMTEDQVDAMAAEGEQRLYRTLEKIANDVQLDPFEMKSVSDWLLNPETRAIKGVNCGIARNTAIVDNKGNLYPCHRYEGMENYIIGNVFTGLDYEATMGYYRKVNRNATSRCHSCWIRDYCTGGCAWLLSSKDGTIVDPTVRECNRRRRGFELLLHARQTLRKIKPHLFDNRDNRRLEDSTCCGEGNGKGASCKCEETNTVIPIAKN